MNCLIILPIILLLVGIVILFSFLKLLFYPLYYWLVKTYLKITHFFKSLFNPSYRKRKGHYNKSYGEYNRDSSSHWQHSTNQNSTNDKLYNDSDGDYIDFEEIK